jgi:hypothetical protein
MARHPEHQLSPVHRRRIYAVLGAGDRGRRARGHLAVHAAQRVLPVWTSERPDDPVAEDVLRIAQAVLGRGGDRRTGAATADRAWRHMEAVGESHGGEPHRSLLAGLAAVAALREALGEDPFEGVTMGERTTDADLDPWSSDAAVFAVGAVAGAAWEADADPDGRRDFWDWWLSAAVPAAVHAAGRPGA